MGETYERNLCDRDGSLALAGGTATAETTPSPSVAHKPITVQAEQRSLAVWSADVSRSLRHNMVYPRTFARSAPDEGAVRVTFRCTEDGRPGDLALAQSSRSRALDRAALAAIGRIDTLSPLPDGVTPNQPMEAWLIFATDEASGDRMKDGLEKQRARRAEVAANRSDALLAASLAPIVFTAH
jgi:TonB family protein